MSLGIGPLDEECHLAEMQDSYWGNVNIAPDGKDMSMHSHESHLAENKLRLYWDRVRDLPVKAKKGI